MIFNFPYRNSIKVTWKEIRGYCVIKQSGDPCYAYLKINKKNGKHWYSVINKDVIYNIAEEFKKCHWRYPGYIIKKMM